MKVLYVSGYTDDATIYSGEFATGTAFLQKPFTLGSLLDKVREVWRGALEAPGYKCTVHRAVGELLLHDVARVGNVHFRELASGIEAARELRD